MSNSNDPIIATLNTGGQLPFRETTSRKTGRKYNAVLKPKDDGSRYDPGRYGVKVDPCVIGGQDLPSSVKVGQTTLQGVEDTTMSGNPKVIFVGPVKVNGQTRKMSLSISKLPSGDFNVSGHMSGPREQNRQGGKASTGPVTSL